MLCNDICDVLVESLLICHSVPQLGIKLVIKLFLIQFVWMIINVQRKKRMNCWCLNEGMD